MAKVCKIKGCYEIKQTDSKLSITLRVPDFVKSVYYLPRINNLISSYFTLLGISPDIRLVKSELIEAGIKCELIEYSIETKSLKAQEWSTILGCNGLIDCLEKDLRYLCVPKFDRLSLFDILGPIMIGPSSSHTAGANRIGRFARHFAKAILKGIKNISVQLHDSFRTTGKGHGTDRAIIAGLAGWAQDGVHEDTGKRKFNAIPMIFDIIKTQASDQIAPHLNPDIIKFEDIKGGNKYHPNTAKISFNHEASQAELEIVAESWGGGNIQLAEISYKNECIYFEGRELKRSVFSGKNPVALIYSENSLKEKSEHLKGESHYNEILISETGKLLLIELNRFEKEKSLSEIKKLFSDEDLFVIKPIFDEPESYLKDDELPEIPVILTLDDLTESPIPVWRLALDYEIATQRVNEDFVFKKLDETFEVMKNAVELAIGRTLEGKISKHAESYTGYKENAGAKLADADIRVFKEEEWMLNASAYAIGVAELNAKMNAPIVAAPTAGACGIIPGVLFAILEKWKKDFNEDLSKERVRKALLTAAYIGLIINNLVPTAGAQYGCQAETGTGAAMASAMAAVLTGEENNNEIIVHSAVLTLKNSLGLACDPVGGKVEVPCIKRNGMKASEAILGMLMAKSGVRSYVKPWEVIVAMEEIGRNLNKAYKETAEGGLAITPSARIKEGKFKK